MEEMNVSKVVSSSEAEKGEELAKKISKTSDAELNLFEDIKKTIQIETLDDASLYFWQQKKYEECLFCLNQEKRLIDSYLSYRTRLDLSYRQKECLYFKKKAEVYSKMNSLSDYAENSTAYLKAELELLEACQEPDTITEICVEICSYQYRFMLNTINSKTFDYDINKQILDYLDHDIREKIPKCHMEPYHISSCLVNMKSDQAYMDIFNKDIKANLSDIADMAMIISRYSSQKQRKKLLINDPSLMISVLSFTYANLAKTSFKSYALNYRRSLEYLEKLLPAEEQKKRKRQIEDE
jgi:hypothetical protein